MKMKRRNFLKFGCVFGTGIGLTNTASALLSCSKFNNQGIQQCEAGINSSVADITTAAVGGQYLSQWCWAACIEMVFKYYGLRVPQAEIVRQAWGRIVNLPGQPQQILNSLNRDWIDARGRRFRVYGDIYTARPDTAAQDLSDDKPLIIGTMGHAMVLTSLTYVRDVYGKGQVNSAVVRDPWPNRGRRVLTEQEWFNTSLLVRIRVHRV